MTLSSEPPDSLIVLAGGLGTRLREAVPGLPKPMAPVAGRPFLEHLLDWWIGQGIRRFRLAVGYRAELIQLHFGSSYKRAHIEYSIESSPLGTGGAIRQALDPSWMDRPFGVVNGDTYFEFPLLPSWEHHQSQNAELTLGLARHPGESRYEGVVLANDGRITSFTGRDQVSEKWVNGGVYLFQNARLFDTMPPGPLSFEQECLPAWLRENRRIQGYRSEGLFIDIGIPEDYQHCGALLAPTPKEYQP